MVITISIILVIIALIIIGLLFRKRFYDKVDQLEAWKMDIMNRNIAAELAQMKELNLSGETEEKFEAWRKRWDSIVTTELGDISELLYDAEHNADRYRFKTSKQLIGDIEQHLHNIEKDLEKILQQLNELLEAEEESRKGIEELRPLTEELRTHIAKHKSDYYRAQVRYEVEFTEIEAMFDTYDELIANGNYAQGKELVHELKEKIDNVQADIDQYPELYKQCNVTLPRELDDLYDGIKEMYEEYRLSNLNLGKEINEYQTKLIDGVHTLEKQGIENVATVISEVEERIKEMYDLLEAEALAKNFVKSKVPGFAQALTECEADFEETKEEVNILKQAYHFSDKDLESYLALEKSFNAIQMNFATLTNKLEQEEALYSTLRKNLENNIEQLEKVKEEHNQFIDRIDMLREDEVEAREQIEKMRRQIYETNRKLRKSNLPGVPSFIWNLLEEATEKNESVLKIIEHEPIDIADVRHTLEKAQQAVERAMAETDQVIEQAYLTEYVIQYANRYRSSNPELSEQLSESEKLFRKSNYELALEKAAKAIEEVEPGVLKRIEEQIQNVS